MPSFLLIEVADRIATVTINRPDKLNALNKDVITELGETFKQLHADPNVAAIILTGAGRAFVAGADIAEISAVADTKEGLAEVSRFGSNVFTNIERGPKPCIAAINGFALGGGLELALACHVRIASTSAKFGLPEVKLGLIPGYGGTQRLPRLIGSGNALQMILTAGMIDTDRALAMGLVQLACTPEGLMPAAMSMAKEMAAQGPLALAHAIAAVNEGAAASMDDALKIEGKHFDAVGRTADGREGTSAFLEKRAPNFRGA